MLITWGVGVCVFGSACRCGCKNLNSIYTIVGCADNCAVCNDATASQCTQCDPGYILTGGSPSTCSRKQQ